MNVTGNVTTKNSPTALNEVTNVPFNLPPGGEIAKVEVATGKKVSLNGNVLAPSATTLTVGGTNAAPHFVVTNKQTAAWPPVSSLVVECYYPSNLDTGYSNLVLTLDDHEVRISELETRVDALEAAAP